MATACRIRFAVAGPSLALAALVAAGPSAYAFTDYLPRSAPHARPTRSPDPAAGAGGLAGTRAGEGRAHPGRDADGPELGTGTGTVPGSGSGSGAAAGAGTGGDGGGVGGGRGTGGGYSGERQAALGQWRSPPDGTQDAGGDAAEPRRTHVPGSGFPPAQAAGPQIPPPHGAGSATPPAGDDAGGRVAVVPRGTTTGPHAPGRDGGGANGRSGRLPDRDPHHDTGGDSAGQAVEPPGGRVFKVLPLGTGLALMGAGIGVIALRLRRR